MDASEADSSFSLNTLKASACFADISLINFEAVVNMAGDLVTAPSPRQGLPVGKSFIYL
jgi:hypothetical protein